jgi:hypothetical protein
MTDTAIVGENVEVIQAGMSGDKTPFSWSAAIAGAIGATAITFMVIALGSGIGLYLASPYASGPSAKTLTVAGAVWLLMAHTLGFGAGGYLAGRLRSHAGDMLPGDETRFRDAAQGFIAWAIGAVAMAVVLAFTALYAAGAATQLAAGAAAGTGAALSNPQNTQNMSATDTTGYFVDMLFRPGPSTAAAGRGTPPVAGTPGATVGAAPGGAGAIGSAQQSLNAESRAEATRIVARGVAQGGLTDDDRTYLAQVVAQRTGLPEDEAKRRVADVETKAKDAAREAGDKAAKAGSYFSFWSFMSMLFAAAAATLGGMVGGDLRDRDTGLARRGYA